MSPPQVPHYHPQISRHLGAPTPCSTNCHGDGARPVSTIGKTTFIIIVFVFCIGHLFGQTKLMIAYRYNQFITHFSTDVDMLITAQNNTETIFFVPSIKTHYYWPYEYFFLPKPLLKIADSAHFFIVQQGDFLRMNITYDRDELFENMVSTASVENELKSNEIDTLECLYDFISQSAKTGKYTNKAVISESYGRNPEWSREEKRDEIPNLKKYFRKNKKVVNEFLKGEASSKRNPTEVFEFSFVKNNKKIKLHNKNANIIYIAQDTNGRMLVCSKIFNGEIAHPEILNDYNNVDLIFKHRKNFYLFKNLKIEELKEATSVQVVKSKQIYESRQRRTSSQKINGEKAEKCVLYIDGDNGDGGISHYDKLFYKKVCKDILQVFFDNNCNIKPVFY